MNGMHFEKAQLSRIAEIAGTENADEIVALLSEEQKAVLFDYKPCLIPPRNLRDPVRAIKEASHDPTCKLELQMDDGTKKTAVQIQSEFLEMAQKYLSTRQVDPVTKDVVAKWEYCLDALARQLGLRGTPFTITDTGRVIGGYKPAPELVDSLDSDKRSRKP